MNAWLHVVISHSSLVWFFCKGCVTLSLVKIPRHLLTCSLMLLFSHERLSPRPPDPHQKTGKFWQKKVQIWRSKRVFVQQMSDCCQNSLHHLHHLGKKEKKKFLRCPWQEKRGIVIIQKESAANCNWIPLSLLSARAKRDASRPPSKTQRNFLHLVDETKEWLMPEG